MREAHKRNRNPAYKTKYRVKNWSQYDKALRNRGDITLWFSTEAIKAWTPKPNGGRGRLQRVSDLAIETVLTACNILNRMTELGMPNSIALRG